MRISGSAQTRMARPQAFQRSCGFLSDTPTCVGSREPGNRSCCHVPVFGCANARALRSRADAHTGESRVPVVGLATEGQPGCAWTEFGAYVEFAPAWVAKGVRALAPFESIEPIRDCRVDHPRADHDLRRQPGQQDHRTLVSAGGSRCWRIVHDHLPGAL